MPRSLLRGISIFFEKEVDNLNLSAYNMVYKVNQIPVKDLLANSLPTVSQARAIEGGEDMGQEVKVTNSEWYVMECLWQKSHQSLTQIVPQMKERVGWSKSTCATMLRRMTEKELIGYQEDGKTKHFYPKVSRQDVEVQQTRDFLHRIYDGSIGLMMSTLVRQNDLSQEDIQELQEILQKAQSDKK